ncbi:unnamed protein product [Trifolium pratense]|uniref:Uncharacterized protein n=1 Tax=Trifolium pratense TaxID=57577 RepID=A0ACB0LQ99_TRIPR|nr:unnamed protein product [Trifolium pratense]
MWKVMNYGTTKPYTSDSQDKQRYRYFKKAICDRPQTRDQFRFNLDVYADRSEEELKKLHCYKYHIFKSEIKCWPMYAEFKSLFFGGDEEEPTDFVPKVEDDK